jgi:hypothetical protein
MYPTVNRCLALCLLAASAAAQTSGSAPNPTASGEDENTRKARALVKQTIEALGGQAYLTALEKSEAGRFYTFFHGESNSAGTPFRLLSKYPDKERLEIIGRGNYLVPLPLIGVIVVSHQVKNKNDVVVIHQGDKGYEITYKGTAAEEPAENARFLRRRKHSLDLVLRQWINQPGVALIYLGPTVAENKPCDQIQMVDAQNDSVILFLDQTTHLPIKTSYSWRDPSDKLRSVEESVYDNYKPVEGVMTPHSITRYLNGEMSYQRFMNEVSFSHPLSDSLFEASVSYDPRQASPKH